MFSELNIFLSILLESLRCLSKFVMHLIYLANIYRTVITCCAKGCGTRRDET